MNLRHTLRRSESHREDLCPLIRAPGRSHHRSGCCRVREDDNWAVGSGGPGTSDDGLQAQIDALVGQMAALRSDLDAHERRADKAEARADTMESRAEIDRDMIAELSRDGVVSREHVAQLEEALKSSRTIGAAIGIIMESRHVSEDAAFEALKTASSHSNRKLREIAAELVASANH